MIKSVENSTGNLDFNKKSKRIKLIITSLLALIFVALLIILDFLPSNNRNLDNLKFTTGSFSQVSNADNSLFESADSSSYLVSDKEFIRVVFDVSAKNENKNLYISSAFSQFSLYVNDEKKYDSITLNDVFSDSKRNIINIEKSNQIYHFNIIFKNRYAANLKLNLVPVGSSVFVNFQDIISIVWIFIILISALLLIIEKRRIKIKFNLSYFVILLLSIATTLNVYSQFASDYQKTLSEISFILTSISGVLLVNLAMKSVKTTDELRQMSVGIGILFCSVIFSVSSSLFAITLIKLLGIYFIICAAIVIVFLFLNKVQKLSLKNYLAIFILYCITFLPTFLYFYIKIPSNFLLYFQIVFPALSVMYSKLLCEYSTKKVYKSEIKKLELLRFKPSDLGRFNDLLNLFLKEQEYLIHSRNVSLYTFEICKALGINEENAEQIAQVAFLHDIGKMMIPKATILKPDKLTPDEYEQVKLHTKFGSDLFSISDDNTLKMAKIVALQHHEHFDGNGYYGMKGNEINKYAQIVSIADVFDAATTKRSYKESWSFEESFEYILSHGGTMFNQAYVNAFESIKSNICTIYNDTRE